MPSNRRDFITTAAAGTAALTVASGHHASAAQPTKKLRVGVIGVGWYGMVDAKAALQDGNVEIVAICDVDKSHLSNSADDLKKLQGSKPATFTDYEKMLDMTDLDIVIIGTPPHWHALQLIEAVKRGIHVYCEKPLTYDVREGQALVQAVNAADSKVQVGFQRRQSKAFADVKSFIEAGNAGRIVQADVQIHYKAGTKDNTPQSPPESLDWNQWCGPAPLIPYSPQVGHKSWRLEKTTGHGHLVDWGIHNIDATRMILDLDLPKRITADGGLYQYEGKITTPDTLTAHFEYDELPVVWRHRLWGATEMQPDFNNGITLYGEDATIFTSDQKWIVFPKGKNAEPIVHESKTDLGTKHMANFLAAVRGQAELACPIDQGFRSTATVQMAMIAYESSKSYEVPDLEQAIDDSDHAHTLLIRPYRDPWVHPYSTT